MSPAGPAPTTATFFLALALRVASVPTGSGVQGCLYSVSVMNRLTERMAMGSSISRGGTSPRRRRGKRVRR